MYQSAYCSCLLRPHWPGEEAGVDWLKRSIGKCWNCSCRELDAFSDTNQCIYCSFPLEIEIFLQTIFRKWFKLHFINDWITKPYGCRPTKNAKFEYLECFQKKLKRHSSCKESSVLYKLLFFIWLATFRHEYMTFFSSLPERPSRASTPIFTDWSLCYSVYVVLVAFQFLLISHRRP
jgi:hypothetical protein